MTPLALLGFAQRLLAGLGPSTSGYSARLAALVARQALEECVTDRCLAVAGTDVGDATMRSRLAILKSLDDRGTADQLESLWNQLSASCHQHAYELSPTVAEVRALCEQLAEVLTEPGPTSVTRN